MNGFEVYDTEEAILYFLEQDPEIVLSVARPIRKVTVVITVGSVFAMNTVTKFLSLLN